MTVKLRGSILFWAGALVALGAGWAAFPRAIYTRRAQPVDFSHKVHADKAGTKCEICHALLADGTYAGVPSLEKCAGCHAVAMGTTLAEKNFIERYVTPGREPEWLSYARQPENVFFSHAAHIKLGKVKCESCHGARGTADHLEPYQEDRISGYSRAVMKMDDCVACHKKEKRENSCLDCHK